MNSTVLITGGYGYLGGRIAKALGAAGYRVLIGEPAIPPGMADDGGGEFRCVDIMCPDSMSKVFKEADAVVHLAAVNEIDSARDPVLAFNVNTMGTMNAVMSASASGVKRFIYFSTAHVYASPLTGYFDENKVCRPSHPYSITHKAAEDFVIWQGDTGRIESVVIRLSNGFGYPVRPDVNRWTLLANDLCRQSVTTKKLVLKSSGLQKRDFITLKDVGRAVLHLIKLDPEKFGNGIFNVGGDSSISVFDLALRIAERTQVIMGYKPLIERPEPTEEELTADTDLVYSVEKIKSTGFKPSGDFNEEIDRTLALCREAFLN